MYEVDYVFLFKAPDLWMFYLSFFISPLTFMAIKKPAICAGVHSPRKILLNAAVISSGDNSRRAKACDNKDEYDMSMPPL